MQTSVDLNQLLAGLRLRIPRNPDDPRQVSKAAVQNEKLIARTLDKALKKVEAFERKVSDGKKAVLKLSGDLPVLRYDPRVDEVPPPLQVTLGDAALASGELRALPPAERLGLALGTIEALTGGTVPLPGPPPQATPPGQDPVNEVLPPVPPVPAPAPPPTFGGGGGGAPPPPPAPPTSAPAPLPTQQVEEDVVSIAGDFSADVQLTVEPWTPDGTFASITSVGVPVGGTFALILPGFSTDQKKLTVSGNLSAPATAGQQLLLVATPREGSPIEILRPLATGATNWQIDFPELEDETYEFTAQVLGNGLMSSQLSDPYRIRVSAGGYDIDLVIDVDSLLDFGFLELGVDTIVAAFDFAINSIEKIIFGNLPSVVLNDISQPVPRLILVDDLIISVEFYEGESEQVLASAGPNLIRSSNGLPVFGTMQFDLLDIDFMLEEDIFESVVIHEMAHVLGLGTLWQLFGLNTFGGMVNGEPVNQYIGPNALREYNALLDAVGLGAINATFVPLANEPGFAHWDEDIFGNELMTPFVAPGALPFSALSIGALEDLGYKVRYKLADVYSLPGSGTESETPLPSATPAPPLAEGANIAVLTGRDDQYVVLNPHMEIFARGGIDLIQINTSGPTYVHAGSGDDDIQPFKNAGQGNVLLGRHTIDGGDGYDRLNLSFFGETARNDVDARNWRVGGEISTAAGEIFVPIGIEYLSYESSQRNTVYSSGQAEFWEGHRGSQGQEGEGLGLDVVMPGKFSDYTVQALGYDAELSTTFLRIQKNGIDFTVVSGDQSVSIRNPKTILFEDGLFEVIHHQDNTVSLIGLPLS